MTNSEVGSVTPCWQGKYEECCGQEEPWNQQTRAEVSTPQCVHIKRCLPGRTYRDNSYSFQEIRTAWQLSEHLLHAAEGKNKMEKGKKHTQKKTQIRTRDLHAVGKLNSDCGHRVEWWWWGCRCGSYHTRHDCWKEMNTSFMGRSGRGDPLCEREVGKHGAMP